MRKLTLVLATVALTGCSTIANIYDRNDPCQTGQFSEQERLRLGRPVGYQQPSWCGAGRATQYKFYDSNGRYIGYAK